MSELVDTSAPLKVTREKLPDLLLGCHLGHEALDVGGEDRRCVLCLSRCLIGNRRDDHQQYNEE